MRTLAAMAIVISALTVQGPTVLPKDKPADSITREELRDHVYFLASDFLGGRRPDDAGYNIAAEYAASQFRSAGVRPAFTAADGTPTYFQKVPLMRVTTSIDRPFTLSTAAGDRVIGALDDFRLMSRGPSLSKVPMVFIGYGISEPDHGWDDVKGVDLKGKVAVMLLGAPLRDGKPVLPAAVHKSYEGIPGIGRRSPGLRQNRPDALLIVVDKEYADSWDLLPNVIGQSQIQYRPGGGPGTVTVPPAAVAFVKGAVAEAIFAGQDYNPLGIPGQGLAGYKTFEFRDTRLSLGIRAVGEDFESVNVVGLVPGTDPTLADQVVTVGAHLDHINPAGGKIRNGADDNASGSAGVIEIAEAVAARPFRRPVLFCLFTAEESGFIGSRHFVSAPPVPMAGIIVNLNLDMIGRSDADASKTRKHYVIGSAQITPELKTIIAGVNAKTVKWPLDFESQESSMSGSDHYNFHRQGIPTAFFFSGRHEDLHAPTDDPEKVDFEKVQRLSQLVYEVTAELSNRDKPIKPPVPQTSSSVVRPQ
jgi:Zn-dependent M28 family amino/carboxypeptidase